MLRQCYAGSSCKINPSSSSPSDIYLPFDSYFPPTFNDKYKHKKTKREVIRNFDFIGLILLVGGLLIFLMGISWGGSLYPWKSVHVIATILIGIVSLISFVVYEIVVPLKEPLVPMYLFQNGPWVADTMLVAFGASVYYAFAIVWPTMVFTVYTSDLTKGGLLCCVNGGGANAGQFVAGIVSRRVGKQKNQLIFATICMAAFLGGNYMYKLNRNSADSSLACACATPFNQNTVVILLFLGFFGMGWLEIIGTAITGISIKDQAEIGTAVGVAGSIRSSVSTVASTIYTVILTNRLEMTIPSEVPPKLIAAGLPATSVPSFLDAVQVGTPAAFAKVQGLTTSVQTIGIAAYKLASSHAYQTVFYSTIAFSTVAVILSLFTPNVDDLMTDKVTATLRRHKREGEGVEKN